MSRLNRRNALRLGRVLSAFETGRLNQEDAPEADALVAPLPNYIGKASETIDAMDGDTPGSGLVEIWGVTDSGDIVDTGLQELAYNLTANEISEDDLVMLKRESIGGALCIESMGTSTRIVKVTSLTAVGDYYPAVLQTYDGTWHDGDAVWCLPANGEIPLLNSRYVGTKEFSVSHVDVYSGVPPTGFKGAWFEMASNNPAAPGIWIGWTKNGGDDAYFDPANPTAIKLPLSNGIYRMTINVYCGQFNTSPQYTEMGVLGDGSTGAELIGYPSSYSGYMTVTFLFKNTGYTYFVIWSSMAAAEGNPTNTFTNCYIEFLGT